MNVDKCFPRAVISTTEICFRKNEEVTVSALPAAATLIRLTLVDDRRRP